MKRLLNYIKNLFTKPIEEKLADALHKLTAKEYADLEMESESIECVEEDCFVIMYIKDTNKIEYVFYDKDKREITTVDDIDSCSRFKLTESSLVHEVIMSMISVGMFGTACLLRTREDEDKRLLECISMSLEKLALFAKKESTNLVN
jgi:hypothetical protein